MENDGTQYSTRFATATQQSHGMEFTKSAHKYLRFLQNYLVLSPTDKAARNVSFICKRLYVTEILKNEFINSGAYLEVKTPEMDIIQEHRNFLSRLVKKNLDMSMQFQSFTSRLQNNDSLLV